MLIPHTFNEPDHIYLVPNEYCLSTSAIIELNGLSNFDGVPQGLVRFAGHRGSALHLAVLAYETDGSPEEAVLDYQTLHKAPVFKEAMERFRYYLRWRGEHDVRLAGGMEIRRVFRHEGTERLVGCTADMPCFIDGVLTVLDLKTSHKQYGQMALKDRLKWELQLQSCMESLEADEPFRSAFPDSINKGILHLHSACGKNGTKGGQSGFEYHEMTTDFSHEWDSAIRMAYLKYAHGYRLAKRESDLNESLRASLQEEEICGQ